jgi:hypothetical protein
LKAGGSIDLTTSTIKSGYNVVVTIEEKYLNDPYMSDLVDGTFWVMGKVIQASKNPDDSVSLLRKTALGKMPPESFKSALLGLGDGLQQKGFTMPKLTWDVSGPVVQVIPIAIFA